MADATFETGLKYSLESSGAESGLDRLAAKADVASNSFFALGAAIVGSAAFHEGKKLFIDLNSEMEQLKISMAAVMSYNLGGTFEEASNKSDKLIAGWQQFSKTTTLTTQQLTEFGSALTGAVSNAGGSLDDLDKMTKKGAVVGQLLSAGHAGGLQYVQLEIREALMGNVRRTQMFNQQLLGPTMKRLGKDIEDFNKLASGERLKIIQQALADPAWEGAIAKMKNSWLGVTSTLKDNIEIAAREVGLPLFRAMSTEVAKWNKWIEDHPKEIEEFGTKFASALIDGFNTIKSVVSFIVENKDTIISMAQAWGISKLAGVNLSMSNMGGAAASMMGGGGFFPASNYGRAYGPQPAFGSGASFGVAGEQLKGMVKGQLAAGLPNAMQMVGGAAMGFTIAKLTGADSEWAKGAMAFTGALSQVPGIVGDISKVVLLLQAGVQKLFDIVDEREKKEANATGEFASSFALYNKGKGGQSTAESIEAMESRRKEIETWRDAGEYWYNDKKAQYDKELEQIGQSLDDKLMPVLVKIRESGAFSVGDEHMELNAGAYKAFLAKQEGLTDDQRTMALHAAQEVFEHMSWLALENFLNPLKDITQQVKDAKPIELKKGPTQINVQKIEVASEDPDRFAMGLVGAFDKISERPTQADSILASLGHG